MDDVQLQALRRVAAQFREAIEGARAERAPSALPYFPEGACRLTSRLLAQHLTRRPESVAPGLARLVSGVLPASELSARHYWLEVDGTVVDLTADAFGEAPVVVGAPTEFHRSLRARIDEDAGHVLARLSADEAARLGRQLAAIESRMPDLVPPAA